MTEEARRDYALCRRWRLSIGVIPDVFDGASGDYQFRAEFGVAVSCFQIVSLPKSEAW
jgi:hypothetical protein